MRSPLLPIEQILSILAETPPRLAALVAGLGPAQLHTVPNPGAWSANDNLAHLRACNDVWGGNIRRLLAEHRPTLRGLNPRAWMKKTDYLEQEFAPSLRIFTTQRLELLAVLQALPPEGWSRQATVIDMVGKRLERSVLGYADSLARHERSHVRQIEGIVNALRQTS